MRRSKLPLQVNEVYALTEELRQDEDAIVKLERGDEEELCDYNAGTQVKLEGGDEEEMLEDEENDRRLEH